MSGEAEAVASWLARNRGQTITARSTWALEGTIFQSDEEDVVVVPLAEAKRGGQAATCLASVTIRGKPQLGQFALRAELLGSTIAALEKREVAVKMAQIAAHNPQIGILLRPWRTAQTSVPAHAVGSPRDGSETVVLDVMQWADEFSSAFDNLSARDRVGRAVDLAIPLLIGLDHIHRNHKVIHRDIHPSNVLVADKSRLVLIDWGIASVVTQGTSTLTAPMGKKGPYLAPETLARQPIGSFTDAWAMGVLLCEMACGEPLEQVDVTGTVRLPDSADSLPAWLRSVVTQLTMFDRLERMTLEDSVAALRAGQDLGEADLGVKARDLWSETTAPPTATAAATYTAETVMSRRTKASELFDAAYEYGRAGRIIDALTAYSSVIETCSDDPDLVLRQHMAMALCNTQWTQYKLGQHREAVATCLRLVEALGRDSDLLVRQQVAIGLNSSGYSRRALSQHERAISDWEDVISRSGNDPDSVLRRQVASALRDKGLALAGLDRRIDALNAYTRLIESFEHDSDPQVRRQVALALNNKRSCLYSLGHHTEALAACTRLVEVFGVDSDTVVRQQVATALHSKGLILDASQHWEGAVAAYAKLVDMFSSDVDPSVHGSVQWAQEWLRIRRQA